MDESSSFSQTSILQKTLLASLLAIFALGFSSMAASADTGISSCSDADANITSSGVYNITSNVLDASSTGNACINITTSDVILDGLNSTINASTNSVELVRAQASSTLSNITVKNLTLRKSVDEGVHFKDVKNSELKNLNISNTDDGIRFDNVRNSNVSNSTITSTSNNGIALVGSGSDGNNLTGLEVKNSNGDGINIGYGVNNEIWDSNITGNTGSNTADLRISSLSRGKTYLNNVNLSSKSSYEPKIVVGSSSTVSADNIDMNGTVVDFEAQDISLQTTDYSSLSSKYSGIDKYFNVTNSSSKGYLEINVSYTNSEVSGVEEPGLDIFRKSSGSFSKVGSSKNYDSMNKVYSNITSFSTFGVLDDNFEVDSCQNLTSKGVYSVESDVQGSGSDCIEIKKSNITLNGQNYVLNGSDTTGVRGVQTPGGTYSNITVKNLKVKNFDPAIEALGLKNSTFDNLTLYSNLEGFEFQSAENTVLKNSDITSSSTEGIYVNVGSEDLTIKNSNISSNNKGIYMTITDDKGSYIFNNTINYNTYQGIQVLDDQNTSKLEVSNNTIYDNGYAGIKLFNSTKSVIKYNNISSNNQGHGSVVSAGVYLNTSTNAEIKENHISNNKYFGLRMEYANHSLVENNDIIDNCGGVSGVRLGVLYGDPSTSVNNTFRHNNVSKSTGDAFEITADNTTIYNSTMIANGQGGSGSGVVLHNGDNLNITRSTFKKNKGDALYITSSNNSYISHNYINNSKSGNSITLQTVSHSKLLNNTIYDNNGGGISVYRGTNYTDIKRNDIETKAEAFYFYSGSPSYINQYNNIENNSAIGSDTFVEYRNLTGSRINRDAVRDLEIFNGIEANISGKHFNLTDNSSNLPSLPTGEFSIVEMNAMNKTTQAWMQLNISYSDSKISNLNESSLSIYHYNGSNWEEVSETGINKSQNRVYGNVTSFSPVAVYGEGEPDVNTDKSSIDFGTVDSDKTSTKTVNVTNIGKVNLTLTDISITSDGDNEYSIVDGTDISSDTNVTTTGYYEVDVEFDPDGGDGNSNDADLEIVSNDPDEGTKTLDIDGTENDVSSSSTNNNNNGGSGGGGGGFSAPSADKSRTFFSLNRGEKGVVEIDNDEELGVKTISIYPASDLGQFEINVRKQDGKPAEVSTPGGNVYKYMDISASVDDSMIDNASIEFDVEKSWFEDNNLDVDTLALQRYSSGEWQSLSTDRVGETSTKYSFAGQTPGFSYFAVTAQEVQNDPSTTGDGNQESSDSGGTSNQTVNNQTSTGKPEPDNSVLSSDALVIVAASLLFVVLLVVVYLKREDIEEFFVGEDESSDEMDSYEI